MSQSPQAQTEQTELASLVLHSKTALQQGEALCLRASSSSNASAQDAFDLLALNSRVKWISDAVIEQLKLAVSVAKTIEERRTKLEKQTQDWDTVRAQWTTSLDNLLESLGSQIVPPDFHDSMSDSSIFGSQFSEPEMDHSNNTSEPGHSPTLTIRHTNENGRHKSKKDKDLKDRTRWKTLRDFVDERAIEDAIETIEAERLALDDVLASTADYPSTLHDTLSTIRGALPRACQSIRVDEVLTKQEDLSATMAEQLESLAEHYDKMEGALQEHEAGEVFGEDDLQDMQRDTNELPAIVSELDESCAAIEQRRDELLSAKHEAEHSLEILRTTLDNLDELGDIMGEMLEQQQKAESECAERLANLHQHLLVIEELSHRFTAYQSSFQKLLLEMARRRQYRDAAENIVHGMMAQLDAMAEEERLVREDFNSEHGVHLPSDICLYIEHPPTRWEVVPFEGETIETLPNVDDDLIVRARDAIASEEGHRSGHASL